MEELDLKSIITQYAESMDNPKMLKGLIFDLYPQCTRGLVNVILSVVDEGIALEIQLKQNFSDITVSRWIKRLENNYAYSEKKIEQALALWNEALQNNSLDYDKSNEKFDIGEDYQNHAEVSTESVNSESYIDLVASGKQFTVTCTGYNKGGLIGAFYDYCVFVPKSQIELKFVDDLSSYVGKELRLQALEIAKSSIRREIIASQRVILQEERDRRRLEAAEKKRQKEDLLEQISVGDIVECECRGYSSNGLIVRLNNILQCFVPSHELSLNNNEDIQEAFKQGKYYKFKVLKINKERHNVYLSYKQAQANPWDEFGQKYKEGDVLHGKIDHVTNTKIFVEFEDGVKGFEKATQTAITDLKNAGYLEYGNDVEAVIYKLQAEEKILRIDIRTFYNTENKFVSGKDYNIFEHIIMSVISKKYNYAGLESEKAMVSISDLHLSVRTYNCLNRAAIKYVGDIWPLKHVDLLRIRNFGKKCAIELLEALDKIGVRTQEASVEKYPVLEEYITEKFGE